MTVEETSVNNDISLEYLIEKIKSNRLVKNRINTNKNVSIKISVNNNSTNTYNLDDLKSIRAKKIIVSLNNAITGLLMKRKNKYLNVTRSAKISHHDTPNNIVISTDRDLSDFIVQDSLDKSKTLTYENEFTGSKRPRIIQESLSKRLTIKTNYNFIKNKRDAKNRNNKMMMMSNMTNNNNPIQNLTNNFHMPPFEYHHQINYPIYAPTSNNGLYHYVDYMPQSSWYYIP
jgi:hypothetical protein